ncbi:hypothetical protein GGX14DRAFT_609601 [Mycena pura]|uniref:MARVEL domain-containing protein n=1 Tax=Mycena pura TaxID=153505 RepID=A0AAD6VS50_9AGAR|nr:hypothetical protein GGX14DRAFT_609601 [Mycena pura]
MGFSYRYLRLSFLVTTIVFGLTALAMGGAVIGASGDDSPTYAALALATGALTLLTIPIMIALEILLPDGPMSMIVVEIPLLGVLSVLWLAVGADAAQGLQTHHDQSDNGINGDPSGINSPASGICVPQPQAQSDFSQSNFNQRSASLLGRALRAIASRVGDFDTGTNTNTNTNTGTNTGTNEPKDVVSIVCAETKVITSFGFLVWFFLMLYIITVIIVALTRKHKGVWTSSVANLNTPQPARAEKSPVDPAYGSYPPPAQQNSSYTYPPPLEQHHTGTGGSVQIGTVHG